MSIELLKTARQLVNENRFDEARAILQTISDDPTAKKWLAKLAEISPENGSDNTPVQSANPSKLGSQSKNNSSRSGIFVALLFVNLLVVILLGMIVAGVTPIKVALDESSNIQDDASVPAQETPTLIAPILTSTAIAFTPTPSTVTEVNTLQEWEYLRVAQNALGIQINQLYIADANLPFDEYLNQLGLEGWEMVGVSHYETGGGGFITVNEAYYFKRLKVEGAIYPKVIEITGMFEQ